MKHRTYYLSNGTIRVAGKLITRCAEPYAEGDLISVQLDMELRHISFLKNNQLQGAGDGLPGAAVKAGCESARVRAQEPGRRACSCCRALLQGDERQRLRCLLASGG